ncbi:hypothetical protein BDE18_4109 [Paracoccus pantotrophus]|uniref:Uncharacterized protein n=1 Tax=Paracoccus pantotrophus TaxID=82367 RepID=A0ABX9S590_PARPN|nr:hypothetical protein BDE18_4109 [Paracoccus pantotrophus]
MDRNTCYHEWNFEGGGVTAGIAAAFGANDNDGAAD